MFFHAGLQRLVKRRGDPPSADHGVLLHLVSSPDSIATDRLVPRLFCSLERIFCEPNSIGAQRTA